MDSELRSRLISAFFAVGIALVAIIQGGLIWLLLVMAVVVLAQREFGMILKERGLPFNVSLSTFVSLSLLVLAYVGGIEFATGFLTAGILGALVWTLLRYSPGTVLPEVSSLLTAIIYAGWLPTYAIYLRTLSGGDLSDFGLFAVVFSLAVTFLNDTGAYFVGRRWGKTPLAPSISPKKSWEGFVGGVLFAVGSALLVKGIWDHWIEPVPFAYFTLGCLGFLASLVGTFGDLFESLLKRDARLKDSGTIMPGHGGVLDRIDGALFTVPFLYYAFLILLHKV